MSAAIPCSYVIVPSCGLRHQTRVSGPVYPQRIDRSGAVASHTQWTLACRGGVVPRKVPQSKTAVVLPGGVIYFVTQVDAVCKPKRTSRIIRKAKTGAPLAPFDGALAECIQEPSSTDVEMIMHDGCPPFSECALPLTFQHARLGWFYPGQRRLLRRRHPQHYVIWRFLCTGCRLPVACHFRVCASLSALASVKQQKCARSYETQISRHRCAKEYQKHAWLWLPEPS